jgi:hypothetical protein
MRAVFFEGVPVAKKSVARKAAKKRKTTKSSARGDQSRLDLKPLQRHIRKRIKDLESGRGKPKPMAAAAGPRSAESDEETIERLRNALETLEDICFPSMAIPI